MQRPTSATVFGILNLVFGCLGLCGVVMSLVMFSMPLNPEIPNPTMELMQASPVYAMFLKVSLGLGLIASLVLLAAGIGLLTMKPWGRTLSIGWAVYSIVMGIVGGAMNVVFVMLPLLEQASELAGPQQAAAMGGVIGGGVGACFGLIYPVLLLIFMFRSPIVTAFQPQLDDKMTF